MKKLRVVDLYSGAGGLSTGFENAGARVILAVEADSNAASTYGLNHPKTTLLQRYITPRWNLRREIERLDTNGEFEVLIGGPPCQGWSSLGGRGSTERREGLNRCVDHFIYQACQLRPPAVVMENVRGLATRDEGGEIRRIESRLRRANYSVTTIDLRAADFGVPQLRHRIFVIAIRSDLGIQYEFNPTHDESSWLSVWDAISDLPSIASGENSKIYGSTENGFQREMRGGTNELTWHEAPRHSSKILNILKLLQVEGASRSELPSDLKLTSGFHNTYSRLWADRPAPAITSSAGRISSGRNAHPFDNRALTPREAARLQTFPDSYHWVGRRWAVYRQIGNAVPPKLSYAIAMPLITQLAKIL